MAKNMTRKGLALGAGIGLVASSFVGLAPANAAETLALAPTSGTAYKVLTTSDFDLTVGFTGTESSGAVAATKYLVTNASGATVTGAVYAAGAAQTTAAKVPGTAADVVSGAATSQVLYNTTGTGALGSRSGINLSISPVSATSVDLTVQAFIDLDGDNAIDTNEATSPVRTISFIDHASALPVATVDSAVVGAGTLSATVAIPGFNMDQLDSDDVKVTFYKNGQAIATTLDLSAASASGTGDALYGNTTSAARTNPNTAAWSAADAEMRATLYVDANSVAATDDTVFDYVPNAAGAVYTAKVGLKDHANAWPVIATSVGGATSAAGTVASINAITELNSPSTDGSNKVRSGAGSFTAKTSVTAVTGYSKAGQTVTWTVSEASANSVAAAASISAGGKTLTNSNIASVQKFTVTSVTNALGVATLPITYSGLLDTNTFTVKATALGASAVQATAVETYTVEDSDVKLAASNVTGGSLQTVIGKSFSVSWTLVDQFGQTPVGTFRMDISETGTGVYATTVPFVNGVATFTQTENAQGAEAYTLSADVEKQNLDGTWDNTPGTGNAQMPADVAVSANVTDPTVAVVAVSANDAGATVGGNPLDLTLDDFVSLNASLTKNSVALPTLQASNIDSDDDVAGYDDGQATLTYTVTDSTGALLVGEQITLTAANVQFLNGAASTGTYGNGSITGTTNSSGQFVVKVFSNKAGKHTVTAVAGGVSKTQDLTFRQATVDSGYSVSVTAPASALPGSSFKVVATVVDSYGNPVITDTAATGYYAAAGATTPTFAFTYTGPGLIVAATPTKTGAAGTAEFSVLLGSNDTGVISVTATYDADGTATASAAISASATVNAATAADLVASWTKNLNDGTVKMYAKNIVGAGKVQFMLNGEEIAWVRATSAADSKLRTANGASYLVRTVDLVEGQKNVLEIYVDGVRTTRTAYTY